MCDPGSLTVPNYSMPMYSRHTAAQGKQTWSPEHGFVPHPPFPSRSVLWIRPPYLVPQPHSPPFFQHLGQALPPLVRLVSFLPFRLPGDSPQKDLSQMQIGSCWSPCITQFSGPAESSGKVQTLAEAQKALWDLGWPLPSLTWSPYTQQLPTLESPRTRRLPWHAVPSAGITLLPPLLLANTYSSFRTYLRLCLLQEGFPDCSSSGLT